jgi:hypothetical protein
MTTATKRNETTATDDLNYDLTRTAVMGYMHYNGEDFWRLEGKQWETLYLLGDGFGHISRGMAHEQCWDWSHVRDSSKTAIMAIWEQICWLHNNARLNVAK